MAKIKKPTIKVLRGDYGKRMIFPQNFWDDPVIQQPVLQLTPIQQPVVQQPVVQQPVVYEPEPVQNPINQVTVRSNPFTLPSVRSLFAPQSLKEYMRDYLRNILNIPRLPGPGQLLGFKCGKNPGFKRYYL